MKFYKYQGTGNDFIMIDNRDLQFDASKEHVAQLCHRRFGIGADGLILIQNEEGYDFRMRYFNSDGAEGSMCGNGGRCAVKFAADLGIFENETEFIAVDGAHHSTLKDGIVTLHMIDVEGIENLEEGFFLNTGSPHVVLFHNDVDSLDVKNIGAKIRYSPYWMERGGTNVNFVQIVDANHLKVRTYERGVEDETYSCGTGVTAAAIASHIKKFCSNHLYIQTLGGTLQVALENGRTIHNIYLSGPAEYVFTGTI